MNDSQVRSIFAKNVHAASRDEFELFKTTTFVDATAQNPACLGGPQRLQQRLPAA